MGINPLCRLSTFLWSLSTQMTLCPTSAKQAPVTRPTYPEPIIAISIVWFERKRDSHLSSFGLLSNRTFFFAVHWFRSTRRALIHQERCRRSDSPVARDGANP